MSFFNQTNYLKWTIVALIVLNLVSVGAHWFSRGPGHGPGHRPPPPGGFLERELAFTEIQEAEHTVLREAHFRATREIHRQIEDEKDELFDLFGQENAEELAVAYAQKIGQLQAELEVLTFGHFQNIRKMCTPEQQKKFDGVIMETLRHGPPGGPPHGRGPGHHRPPPPHRQ